MFTYILWGLIVIVLIILAKRIFEGIVLGIFYVIIIIFAVFLLDTITPFPIRSVITLDWYDKTVEDPGGTIRDNLEVAKEVGESAVGKVNEAGKNLDVYYGVEYDKEWKYIEREAEDKTREEKENKKEVGKEKQLDKKENKENKKKEKLYVKYKDVNKVLSGELKELSEGDKDIIRAMTSVYRTRLKGEEIEVWNTEGDSKEGFYIKYMEG